jgi:hypothetical protein
MASKPRRSAATTLAAALSPKMAQAQYALRPGFKLAGIEESLISWFAERERASSMYLALRLKDRTKGPVLAVPTAPRRAEKATT